MFFVPIVIKWLDDLETIFCYEVLSPWTTDDVIDALGSTRDFLKGRVPVAIIFDVREAGMIPKSFLSVTSALRQHRNSIIHIRVLVGPNRIIRLIYNLMNRAFPDLLEGVAVKDTLDEAYDYIVEQSSVEIGKLTADD